MRIIPICIVALLVTQVLFAVPAKTAQNVPHYITYAGYLTDGNDAAVTATYDIVFTLYDALTGGSSVWTETQSSVSISSGYFSVSLGDTTALNLDFDKQYWVEVNVNSDGAMTPRQPVNAVGFAYTSDTTYGAYATTTAPTSPSAGDLYYDTDDGLLYLYDGLSSSWVDTVASGTLADGTSAGALLRWDGSNWSEETALKIDGAGNTTSTGDLVLSNANSNISILESSGGAFYGILDIGDLSATSTFTFSGSSGTVLTNVSDFDTTGTALDWDLLDNNASALSFDSAGSAGILELDTTDGHERVKLSGDLAVSGTSTFANTVAPTENNTTDIGAYGSAWNDLYASGTARIASATTTQITPWTHDTHDLGEFGQAWGNLYVSNTVYLGGDALPGLGGNGASSIGGFNASFNDIFASGTVYAGAFGINGDITSDTAIDWDLLDNNASALSFDSAGKTGIVEIVTTDSSEGVNMSGTLTVTGNGVFNSNNTFGDSVAADTVTFNSTVASALMPDGDNTRDLGVFENAWRNLTVSSTAYMSSVTTTQITPWLHDTYDLGGFGAAWGSLYVSNTVYLGGDALPGLPGNAQSSIGNFGSAFNNIFASGTVYTGDSLMSGVVTTTGGLVIGEVNRPFWFYRNQTENRVEFGSGEKMGDNKEINMYWDYFTPDTYVSGTLYVTGAEGGSGGIIVGDPADITPGAGNINAQNVYDDNVLLADYVFDWYFDGEVAEEDDHVRSQYQMMGIAELSDFVEENRHLPTIRGRSEWDEGGRLSLGELSTQLWETTETNSLYILELYKAIEEQKLVVNNLGSVTSTLAIHQSEIEDIGQKVDKNTIKVVSLNDTYTELQNTLTEFTTSNEVKMGSILHDVAEMDSSHKETSSRLDVIEQTLNLLAGSEIVAEKENIVVESVNKLESATAGAAKIVAGDSQVDIVFVKEFTYTPIINLTLTSRSELNYFVAENISTKGFTISIDPVSSSDVPLNWLATPVNEPKIFVSTGETGNYTLEVKSWSDYYNYEVSAGCIDPSAENYSEEATLDDGTCEYTIEEVELVEEENNAEEGNIEEETENVENVTDEDVEEVELVEEDDIEDVEDEVLEEESEGLIESVDESEEVGTISEDEEIINNEEELLLDVTEDVVEEPSTVVIEEVPEVVEEAIEVLEIQEQVPEVIENTDLDS